ncbi:MAG: DNA-processing protein DprA [Calditrichota bacterium]|jgi:DNA processing protein
MTDRMPQLYDLLYLLTIPNIGPGRIRKLFQVFDSVDAILKAPVQQLIRVEGIDYKLAGQIKNGGDEKTARDQLNLIEKHQVQYTSIWDKSYPALLKRISDPPVILFRKGNILPEFDKSIAVVGTRTPSNYGKLVTQEIVRGLVDRDICIISGLARGVDSIAHHTAIQSGGKTVAVLGCGVDRCYPPENKKLFEDIQNHGAIISEYFIGTGPDAANFPKRNRIISGLSLGTLVIEAGDRSGALISALFALNQDREVFAIPGNINSPKSQGTNRLIKQGAKLVQSVEDILEEFGEMKTKPSAKPRELPDHLGELERNIYRALSNEPKHIDRLVMELKESPGTVLAGLLNLELLGFVQQLVGKMFIRI